MARIFWKLLRRRGRDSNSRWLLATTVFKTVSFNRSDTPPAFLPAFIKYEKSLKSKIGRVLTWTAVNIQCRYKVYNVKI